MFTICNQFNLTPKLLLIFSFATSATVRHVCFVFLSFFYSMFPFLSNQHQFAFQPCFFRRLLFTIHFYTSEIVRQFALFCFCSSVEYVSFLSNQHQHEYYMNNVACVSTLLFPVVCLLSTMQCFHSLVKNKSLITWYTMFHGFHADDVKLARSDEDKQILALLYYSTILYRFPPKHYLIS